ncbi:hypothetical protein ACFL3Y_01945 [Pseudomonadota bacterium]
MKPFSPIQILAGLVLTTCPLAPFAVISQNLAELKSSFDGFSFSPGLTHIKGTPAGANTLYGRDTAKLVITGGVSHQAYTAGSPAPLSKYFSRGESKSEWSIVYRCLAEIYSSLIKFGNQEFAAAAGQISAAMNCQVPDQQDWKQGIY